MAYWGELAECKIFLLCSLDCAGAELWTESVCTCQHNRLQAVTTIPGTC